MSECKHYFDYGESINCCQICFKTEDHVELEKENAELKAEVKEANELIKLMDDERS